MSAEAALEEVNALRADVASAAHTILTAAERGLALEVGAEARSLFGEILEACAFGDIAGQRLQTLEALLRGEAVGGAERGEAGLLNGPAHSGRGLSQAEADALF